MNSNIRKLAATDHSELISIVIPAYNEARGIENTIGEVDAELKKSGYTHEIIVVDDGSSDGTYETLQQLSQKFSTMKAIRLSRNFGKEAALLTGLKASNGRAVITMDADLQHPPATIAHLLEKWEEGFAVVHAIKEERTYDGPLVKWRANLFNAIFEKLGGISLKNSSDFILMDRVAKDIIIHDLPERMRFYRGLTRWVGFKQASIYFKVAERWDKSKGRWSLTSLVNLAATALVSFTTTPLRIIAVFGMITLLVGLIIGLDALISWWLDRSVSGYVTIIGTLLIIGSFIMISLGIIGEYVAKIYEEIKARPPALIESSFGFENCASNHIEQINEQLGTDKQLENRKQR